jgi:hypothetical protein
MAVHVRKTIRLTIDQDSYECEVTGATLTPTAETRTASVLCADGTVSDVAPVTWTLDLAYLVDHKAGSLYRTLVANAGQRAAFTYEPDPETAPGVVWGGTVVLIPGPAGGEAGAWESGQVSLPITGRPAITDPPPPLVTTAAAQDDPDPDA